MPQVRSFHAILTLSVALALTACAPVDRTPATDASDAAQAAPAGATPAVTGVPAAAAPDALGGQAWTLEAATDARGQRIDALFPAGTAITLAFADGRVSASGACNRMSGGYRIQGDALRIGPMVSTRMACDAPLMEAEAALSALLSVPLAHAIQESMPPRLQLRAGDGASSTWVGTPTPEARYGGPGERVFLEVAPQRMPCSHPLIPDHQCLRVREVQYDGAGLKRSTGQWQPLYEAIEGFDFHAGERQILRLKKFTRANPPADASSIVYVLDMVVETETVAK